MNLYYYWFLSILSNEGVFEKRGHGRKMKPTLLSFTINWHWDAIGKSLPCLYLCNCFHFLAINDSTFSPYVRHYLGLISLLEINVTLSWYYNYNFGYSLWLMASGHIKMQIGAPFSIFCHYLVMYLYFLQSSNSVTMTEVAF